MQQPDLPPRLDAGELALVWRTAMKLETILKAYDQSIHRLNIINFSLAPLAIGDYKHEKYWRMSRAFRARILRMDAEKEKEIARLEKQYEDSIEFWDGG